MKNSILLLLSLVLPAVITFAQNSTAQSPAAPAQFAPNTVIPAELSKPLDAKKLKVGDQFEAKTTVDMLSNGKIVMPRNSKVLGHVTAVKAHSKESPDSMVGIVFDRLVMKDGSELPLQASVQAIGAPLQNVFSTEGAPAGGLSPGLQPSMGGSSAGGGMGGSRSGGTPATQPVQPSMPSNPDNPSNSHRPGGALSAESQGVVGIKDLSLSATPQASVVSSSNKNVHLDGGTQLMLRVQ